MPSWFLLLWQNYLRARLPKQWKQVAWKKIKFRLEKAAVLPETRDWNWSKKQARKSSAGTILKVCKIRNLWPMGVKLNNT